MQTNPSASSGAEPRHPPIQFYAVEITPLEGGHVYVGAATICEEVDDADFELVNMEMAI